MLTNPYAAYQKVATNSEQLRNQEPKKETIHKPTSPDTYANRPSKASNQYLQNEVLTASPEKLTLMLYEGAIKFMRMSILHIRAKELAAANTTLLRAQDIIQALMASLDMEQDVSRNLASLYEFMTHTLVEANIHKDVTRIEQVIKMAGELRDTWAEAMIVART